MSLKSSVTFSTSSNILLTDVWHYQDIPLRYSILREPSSECQVLLSRLSRVLTRGLYSHPVFRSGIHLTQSRLKHISNNSCSPSCAGILSGISQPPILMTNNCSNKPGVAGGTESEIELLVHWDYPTCSRCSSLHHPAYKLVSHCSCQPSCRHQEHLPGAS